MHKKSFRSALSYGLISVLALSAVGCSSTRINGPAPIEERASTASQEASAQSAAAAARVIPVDTSSLSGSEALARLRQEVANLKKVFYFGYDSYEVSKEDMGDISAHASKLLERKDARVTLTGHTDVRGSSEYNLALGEKRASAVAKLLGLQGVSASRMEATSMGKEKPAATGQSEQDHAANRRVEIEYSLD